MTGKTKVDYTGSTEAACEQFRRRRRLATGIEKIENSDLAAGSSMYFQCRHCGLPTEILPELPSHHRMQPMQRLEERGMARRGDPDGG